MNPEEIRAAFDRIKRRNLFAGFVPLVFPFFAFAIYQKDLFKQPEILFVSILPALAAAVWVHLVNWRCPACRAWLGRFFTVSECPSCKVKLTSKLNT